MTALLAPLVPGSRIPPLALRIVVHGGPRTLAALAGVGFVVTMVLLQLGFLQTVRDTATNLYDALDFDVAIISPTYQQLYDAGTVPLDRLRRAEGLDQVVSTSPVYATFAMWRCPPSPLDAAAVGFVLPTAGRARRDPLRPEPAPAAVGFVLPNAGRVGLPGSPGTGGAPAAVGFVLDTGGRGLLAPRTKPVQRRELLALGIDLDRNPFREPVRARVEAASAGLRMDGRVLLNERSHPDFGWWAWPRFDGWELGRHRVEVVGGFPLERGFGADGALICSDATFARLCAPPGVHGVSLGLIRVRPGTATETVRRLGALLPPDAVALTRADLLARERDYWVNQTSTGKIFAAGVLVAMAVAAVVVYQVLSNDVRSHLAEYATLKAMGYTDRFLARVVAGQAVLYALGGFVPALAVAAVAYRVTEALVAIPMRFTAANVGLAFALAVVVSLGSALLTLGKLRSADPAELY